MNKINRWKIGDLLNRYLINLIFLKKLFSSIFNKKLNEKKYASMEMTLFWLIFYLFYLIVAIWNC